MILRPHTRISSLGRCACFLSQSHPPSLHSTSYKIPYVLPSSVGSKSFVCHSYKNCRGVPQLFPKWNSFATLLLCLLLIAPGAFAQQPGTGQSPTASGASNKPDAPWEGFLEDLSSLTLQSSTLVSQKPVLVQSTDILNGKYVRERVQVSWRPNDTFDLYVALPKGVKKPAVILYLYSFPEGVGRFQSEQWYEGVAKDGYAAVGFASALTAERAEHRPPDEWFVSLLPESLAASVHDVQMILNYLDSRGDLDMNRVGMFGTGSGATIAILASAADPRIKAIDVFNPWGDWPVWAAKSWVIPEEERGNDLLVNKYIDPEFLKVVAPLDPVRWLPSVKAQSLRIQSVQSEATVPAETQKKIAEAAPAGAEVNLFKDYRVWMSTEHGPEIFGWLRKELQPDAEHRTARNTMKRVHFFPAEGKSLEEIPAHPNRD